MDFKDDNWKTACDEVNEKIKLMGGMNECFVALFNVNPVNEIEKKVVKLGIRGIFYINNPCDILLKGITTIMKNEIWLSRKLINTIYLEHEYYGNYHTELSSPLSFREKQIIKLLSYGLTNDMIADKLCISIHTVKTHIYNLYRKINVKNRLQAARWANHNLSAFR